MRLDIVKDAYKKKKKFMCNQNIMKETIVSFVAGGAQKPSLPELL
jgi:hypothetical protein